MSKEDYGYVVDLTKPPIPPPNRMMRDCWLFGMRETKESRKRTKAYLKYLEWYDVTLEWDELNPETDRVVCECCMDCEIFKNRKENNG